jgi:hypothetical protein
MLRRSTRILIEVVMGVLAAAALLIGVTVWRLSEEPLHVDFLTPYLENALGGGDNTPSVEIGETVLTWLDWSRTLDLRAREVRLRDASGFIVATLPEISVNLSLRALVQGVVAATEIEVVGARVTLVRWSDGSFDFGLDQAEAGSAEPAAQADFSVMVPALLRELLSEPSPARPLSFLKTVSILDGSLTVFDRNLGTVWRAPSARIEVRRHAWGLAGKMALSLALGPQTAEVEATFRHDQAAGTTDFLTRFSELRFEALAALVPGLAPLSGLEVALDGSLMAGLGSGGRVGSLAFDLNGGAGSLSLPERLPEPLPVQGLKLRGRMDGIAQRLEVETASLRLGPGPDSTEGVGPEFTLKGVASAQEGDLRIAAEARATGAPARDLQLYWPMALAPGAREWVAANIPKGTAEKGWLKTSLRIPAGDFAAVELEALSGGYEFRDLEVHYRRPMPPVAGVSGSATFDRQRMSFDPKSGRLGDLEIRTADIEILDFDKDEQDIDIQLTVAGPLDSALALLDHESLRLVSDLGIDPAGTAGEAVVRPRFRFPLIRDVTNDQLEITAEADLDGVVLRGVLFGRDATNGRLRLELDRGVMTVSGPVEFAGLPIELDWRENFDGGSGPRSMFNIEVERLDDAGRAALDLDWAPYLTGPVSASLVVALYRERRGTLEAVVNLDRAGLSLPVLDWRKPPAVPGELKLALTLADDRIAELERIELKAGSLSARGRGHFGADGALSRLDLDALTVGRSRLSDVALVWEAEGLDVTLGGGVLDAAPILARRETAEGAVGDAAGAAEAPASFRLSAPRLEAVTFAEGRYLEEVALELERDAEGWRVLFVEAKVPRALWSGIGPETSTAMRNRQSANRAAERGEDVEPAPPAAEAAEETERPPRDGTFELDYRAAEFGGYRLEVATEDLGAVLRALDLRDTVNGGRLRLYGRSDGPIPGSPLTARLEVEDYVLVGAPTLASVLSVASLTGLVDTLSGKGIQFDRLSSDFTLTDAVAHTELLHAYGPALGVTAKGEVDFDKAVLDLEGTVVPAYTVNRILGAIPILGLLLTGGEGEGLFAFTYEMTGALDEPTVSVNPLSALAPGFLRGLFGGLDGAEATVYPTGPER